MENKNFVCTGKNMFSIIKKIVVFAILLFIPVSMSFAQDEQYYITEDEKGNQTIFQKFEWQKDDDVLKYEFIVEQFQKGKYVEIAHEETSTNSVSVSLSAGTYRYKIIAYNFLGVVEIESEWIDVEIIKAYQPKINNVSPGSLFLEEMQDGIFVVEGSELRPETEFTLSAVKKNAEGKLKGVIIEDDKRNHRLKIKFNPDELNSANYTLVAKNPGGLKAFYNGPDVRFKKPVDFDVSAAYVFPVVLFDDTVPKYYGSNLFPLSATIKMSLLPIKKNFGYFGFGINAFYSRMDKNFGNYKIGGNLVSGHLNFVYQIPIRKIAKDNKTKRLAATIEMHLGAGVAYFMDHTFTFDNGIVTPALNSLLLSADAGIGAQIYIANLNRLYVDFGVDFSMAFGSDLTLGTLLPYAGVGWQF